jgi:phage recombination protein Bet
MTLPAVEQHISQPTRPELTREQVELIKRTIAKDATDDELALFVGQSNRTGLDPFSRQIHAVKRWDPEEGRKVMSIQVGIDGLRLIAERTGRYEGQTRTYWCGPDGVWKDVWLDGQPPAAARIGVFKRGFRKPLWTVAHYREAVQTRKDGTPNSFWRRMPALMLAKVAEALAIRRAFPQECSGLYTPEEMGTETEVEPARSNGSAPRQLPPPSTAASAPDPLARWQAWLAKLCQRWEEAEPSKNDKQARIEREHRIAQDLVSHAIAAGKIDEALVTAPNARGELARQPRLVWDAVKHLACSDFDWVRQASLDHLAKFVRPPAPEPEAEPRGDFHGSADDAQLARINELLQELGASTDDVQALLAHHGVQEAEQLEAWQADEIVEDLEARLAAGKPAPAEPGPEAVEEAKRLRRRSRRPA